MLTRKDILKQLFELGAPRDNVVLVHTSLKKIGEVEGGAETVLDALIEYFTAEGGLLCIPTHTWGFQNDTTRPTLDYTAPDTCIGVLPTVAARDKRAYRSDHPTHSMAVFGAENKVLEFISGEKNVTTTTSPDGCYGKLWQRGGKILLVGVGQDKNTFLHSVEEMLGVQNRISDASITLTVKYPDGHIEPRILYPLEAKGIADVSEQFPNYEPAFRKHGCIKDGMIGNAKVQLCDTVKMKDVMALIYEKSGGAELLFDSTPINPEWY